MTTMQVRTEVPLSELLHGVQKLDSAALEQFADAVMLLRAKRRAANLSKDEADLLRQINKGLLEVTQTRFAALKEKRQAETLTSPDYDELVAITEQIEERDVERLQVLAELAQMRGISVRELMHQLDLIPADNV